MSSEYGERRAADGARHAAPPRLRARDLLLLLLPCVPLAQVALSRRHANAESTGVRAASGCPERRAALRECGPSAGGERAGD